MVMPDMVPPTIRHDGNALRYVGEDVWSQPTLDESNPNAVIVFASVDAGTAPWGHYCTIGTTAVGRTVAETDEAVTIAVSKYAIRQPGSTACLDIARGPIPVSVALANPLGARRLIDANDGSARKVLDPSTVLKPINLPAGYTAGQATWAYQSETTAQRRYRGPQGDLTLTVGPASLNKPLQNIVRHTTVRQHSATVSYSTGFAYDLLIAWNEDVGHAATLYQISRYQNSQVLGLDVDQLVGIANSLR